MKAQSHVQLKFPTRLYPSEHPPEEGNRRFEGVRCLPFNRVHLVDPFTGKLAREEDREPSG